MADLVIPWPTVRRWLWVAAAFGLAGYCWQFWPVGSGVKLYLTGAQCLLDGLPLQQCDKTFTYPPAFALAMVPFLALPTALLNAVWYAVTLAAMTACFMLSVTLARRLIPDGWTDRETAWLYGVTILLSLKFLFAALGNQSYDTVVVAAVLAGLVWLDDGAPLKAGVAFGIAAALKATPLLLLPYLLFKRHFAAAAMTVATAALSLLPDLMFTPAGATGPLGYFGAWVAAIAEPALKGSDTAPHVFWGGMNGNNYSLRSIVGYFLAESRSGKFLSRMNQM
jgi:hypothetical protein